MYLATGSGKLMELDGVARALKVLTDYFTPGALNVVNQDVVRVLHSKRAT